MGAPGIFFEGVSEAQRCSAIRLQDGRFQRAMRRELKRMASERGLRLVAKVTTPSKAKEPDPIADTLPLPSPFAWKAIVAEVCTKHGVSILDLASIRRSRGLPEARHEAMYRLRHETTMSLPEIGRKLGGRDHSTVLNGIRRHEERMAEARQP